MLTPFSALREQFEPFRDEIQDINRLIVDGTDPETIPGYLGQGCVSCVFRLSTPSLVVKLPCLTEKNGTPPLQAVAEYVNALRLGIGTPNLEQLKGYSKQDPPGVITGFAPDEVLFEYTSKSELPIYSSHFLDLLNAFKAMQQKGLGIEPSPHNFTYSPDSGFTVIDYVRNPHQSLAEKVVDFASGEVLLAQTLRHEPFPEYAIAFRGICAQLLGTEIATAIDEQWEEEGYEFTFPAKPSRYA